MASLPPFQPLQLATLVDAVPSGPGWLFEYKYDGYRLLLATGGGAATAWTRNGHDWSNPKSGLPFLPSATASPSIRQPGGSSAAAFTIDRNLSLQS